MISKCSVCDKRFRFTKNCSTLISLSATGKTVVSYICERCNRNKSNLDKLVRKNDNILDARDSMQIEPC